MLKTRKKTKSQLKKIRMLKKKQKKIRMLMSRLKRIKTPRLIKMLRLSKMKKIK